MTPAKRKASERLIAELLMPGSTCAEQEAADLLRELLAEPQGEPVAWHVCSVNSDGSLSLEFAAPWEELAHEHISDAILDDIDGAESWVVRPVYASPQPQQTEPSQDMPQQRPPTPVGWSDTDWLAHLSTMPPIAYALRDTLYGTSKAGVLRFCAADEPGAFAVYAAPQQRKPLSDEQIESIVTEWWGEKTGAAMDICVGFARIVERAHGITGEPT